MAIWTFRGGLSHPPCPPPTPTYVHHRKKAPCNPLFPRKIVQGVVVSEICKKAQLFAQMAIDTSFLLDKGPLSFLLFRIFFSHSLLLLLLLFQTPEPSKNIPSPTQTQSPLSPSGGAAGKTHTSEKHHLFLVQKNKVGKHFFQNAFSSRSLLFSRPVKEADNYLLFMCMGDLGKIIGRPIQTYLRESAQTSSSFIYLRREKC